MSSNNNNNNNKNISNGSSFRNFRNRSWPALSSGRQPPPIYRSRLVLWGLGLVLWIAWDFMLIHRLDEYLDEHNSSNSNNKNSAARRATSALLTSSHHHGDGSHGSTAAVVSSLLDTSKEGLGEVDLLKTAAEEVTKQKVWQREVEEMEQQNKFQQMEETAAKITALMEQKSTGEGVQAVAAAAAPPTTSSAGENIPNGEVFQRPPLDSILDDENDNIIGDPGFLLDVAVIGFGKCGTSTMMDWIGTHPHVRAFPQEVWDLTDHRVSNFIRRLYTELEPGPFLHGYKAPQDITQDRILDLYRKYWPRAKLIVGSE